MASATTPQKQVTSQSAAFVFYDIESLSNAFTLCAYHEKNDSIAVFYLVEPETEIEIDRAEAESRIFEANPAFGGKIVFYDLRTFEANAMLAKTFGLSSAAYVNNPDSYSDYPDVYRPVCDTHPDYDPFEEHPYLAGYNSFNYDTVILALYLREYFEVFIRNKDESISDKELLEQFIPVSPSKIREYNDTLFTDQYRKYMPRMLTQEFDGRWNSQPSRIRQAMIHSGRHIDVARFNEVQQRVGLKRLLGGLGRQIMESDKLSHNSVIKTAEELYELLAYNVSDVVGLAKLFAHPVYAGGFDLKKGLLEQYPETVFEKGAAGTRDPKRVRRDRLVPDSSSAQFAAKVLAPYAPLQDWEAVSLQYPHPKVAAQRGVESVDVLEASKRFFEKNISDEAARDQFQQVYDYYRDIEGRNFNESENYLTVHGDGSDGYRPGCEPKMLRDVPKRANNVPYFLPDGKPSRAFATFSTGGIHGAEADWDTWGIDCAEYDAQAEMIVRAQQLYPDPTEFLTEAKRQHNILTLPDGTEVDKTLVLIGSDPQKVKWRKPNPKDPEQSRQLQQAMELAENPAALLATKREDSMALDVVTADGEILHGKTVLENTTLKNTSYRKEPSRKRPELFETKSDGSNRLKPKYTFTSVSEAIHEDFTSYYPNLLIGMNAFENPELGEDRYYNIFCKKEEYGAEAKRLKARITQINQALAECGSQDQTAQLLLEEKSALEAEIIRLNVLRNGTKLILNAASGAGDASHDNNIRMNNLIISMRLLGQLFSWRIGQAQTLAGATIISTNTDGLYSTGLDRELNDKILVEQAAATGVEIEPEPMIVVSKDSNNRLELEVPEKNRPIWDAPILGASGGSLACHEEPRPDKSLAHPAVLDWALVRYLRLIAGKALPPWRKSPLSIYEPLDRETARKLLTEARDQDDPVLAARLFQKMVAASVGSLTFPFLADPLDEEVPSKELTGVRTIGHHNRVFFVKKGTPGAASLHQARSAVIPAATQLKRKAESLQTREIDKVAEQVLLQEGYAVKSSDKISGRQPLPGDQDVVRRKVPGAEPVWDVLIRNEDLVEADPQSLRELLKSLDIEIYVELLADKFDQNWRNDTPPQ